MTTLTVNINNKKSEKAVKAVLDALGLDYNISISEIPSIKHFSAHDFLGSINKKDVELMEKAIEKGCEQIHPDDWK